jgi:O-antigen/teichoic acid export membrane protein/glycosyltransferase involved in cell wall biosynthesis
VRITLVVATIGRADALARLFASLAAQTHAPHEVIVVEQGDGGEACAALVATAPFPARHVRLARRGAARARNAGWRLASGDVIGFPDDDCAYPPDTLAKVAAIFASDALVMASSGRTIDDAGAPSIARTPSRNGPVTAGNVWRRCVEPALFVRAGVRARFDPRLGVGASTPWQAYEGPDLLLRLLARGARVTYRADLAVWHPNVLGDFGADQRRRAIGYGRGHGFVLARHRGAGAVIALLLRLLAAATLRTLRGARRHGDFTFAYARAAWRGARDRATQRTRLRHVRHLRRMRHLRRAPAHDHEAGLWAGIGGATLLQGIGMALRYATALLLAAWLGAEAFGTFAWAIAALAVVALLPTQGRAQAAQRFLPAYDARGETALAAAYVRESRAVTLRNAALIAVPITALAWSIATPNDAITATLAAWTLPGVASAAFDAGVLRARGRVRTALAFEQLLAPLLTLVGIVALHGAGAAGALAANAIGVTASAVALRRAAGDAAGEMVPAAPRTAWRRTGRSLLLGSTAQDALVRSDVMMIGAILGAEAAGIAHLASRTASLLLIARQAVAMVTTPRFAALVASADRAKVAQLRGVTQRLTLALVAAIATLLIAVSPPLFAALGGAYGGAMPALVALAIAQVAIAAFGPVAALLEVSGGHAIGARIWAATLLAALPLQVLAITAWGVTGGAVVTAAAVVVATALQAAFVRRRSVER